MYFLGQATLFSMINTCSAIQEVRSQSKDRYVIKPRLLFYLVNQEMEEKIDGAVRKGAII
jgi:hypothetical protein